MFPNSSFETALQSGLSVRRKYSVIRALHTLTENQRKRAPFLPAKAVYLCLGWQNIPSVFGM
jgi:hypothetical protein